MDRIVAPAPPESQETLTCVAGAARSAFGPSMQDPNRAAETAVARQRLVVVPQARPQRRPVFLRWLCLATASALVLVALVLGGFAAGVSGAPPGVALVILGATIAVGALAGVLHWRADRLLEAGDDATLAKLRHDASLVFYAVALFQVLGMIGALLGYRQQTQSAALPDSQAAVHALTLGLGNGLTATLVGVVCSVVVWVMFLHLQHALDKPR